MKNIARRIIRIKLLLGLIWLMLRGNSAEAQSVRRHATCYRSSPRATINLQADVSVSHQIDFSDPQSQITSFQLGDNFLWETHGFAADFSEKEMQWRMGGFLRLFPYDGEKITLMTEFKYMVPVYKNPGLESFSLSTGIILSDHYHFGVELFETMSTDLSEPSGIRFYTGVRVHYYFIKRLCRRPRLKK